MTAGNSEKRYIGRTDEELSEEGRGAVREIEYPECDIVFCSPMKRCLQTAKIIFPDKKLNICDNFRECDFGDFEGKNYAELNGNEKYQEWIDSGGTMRFPGGESPDEFKKRCCDEFILAVKSLSEDKTAAFVVHGGTIMSVLEKYEIPHKQFYERYTENGHGFVCEFDCENNTIGVTDII